MSEEIKNKCEVFDKNVGCFNTFDGTCIKEECFTYRLLLELQHLKQENEELKAEIDSCNDEFGCEEMAKYKQALEEIRDFINPTYFDCKNCKELKKPFTQQNCNGFKYEAILNKIDEVLND